MGVLIFGWGISVGYFKANYVSKDKMEEVVKDVKTELKDEIRDENEKVWDAFDRITDILAD